MRVIHNLMKSLLFLGNPAIFLPCHDQHVYKRFVTKLQTILESCNVKSITINIEQWRVPGKIIALLLSHHIYSFLFYAILFFHLKTHTVIQTVKLKYKQKLWSASSEFRPLSWSPLRS